MTDPDWFIKKRNKETLKYINPEFWLQNENEYHSNSVYGKNCSNFHHSIQNVAFFTNKVLPKLSLVINTINDTSHRKCKSIMFF